MVALATLSFVAALALPALGIVGGSFFPVQDVSEFNVIVETPPGSNIAYTKLKAEEVARLARSRPEVAYTYATIGGSGGMGSASGAVDEANVYVRLTPKHERAKHQEVVAQELRRDVARIGGVSAWISKDTFGNQKEIQVQLRGPDITELNRLAPKLADMLRATPGAVDVGLSTKGQKPEIEVELDRPLAGTLGVTVGQVAQSLRPAFAGIDAGDWVDPLGKTRDVTVRLVPEARASVADLERLPLVVRGPAGPVAIPLGQVARINRGLGPAKIDHLDRERVITIQANTENRALTEVIREFEAKLASFPLPAGYEISQGGQTKDQQEVFTRILVALGVALLLMYFVLVVQFGSFLDPLAILLSLPLSLIGVMLALWMTGSTLNIMSMIGVILLMGIVAKNAILLIDFAKAGGGTGPAPEGRHRRGRARAVAAHPDDDLRPDRRDDPRGDRVGRGCRLPRAAGPRGDWRRHHVHRADAARDPDRLRHHERLARPGDGPVQTSERQRVTAHVLRDARREIRELNLTRPPRVQCEPAFLEHVPRWPVIGVADRVEAGHADAAGNVDHRSKRLGGVAQAPGILGENVAGHRQARIIQMESGAAEQLPVAPRPDEIGPGARLRPLAGAEREEGLRVGQAPVPRPAHVARHVRVAGVSLEDGDSISGRRRGQHEPFGFDAQRRGHGGHPAVAPRRGRGARRRGIPP